MKTCRTAPMRLSKTGCAVRPAVFCISEISETEAISK